MQALQMGSFLLLQLRQTRFFRLSWMIAVLMTSRCESYMPVRPKTQHQVS
jgi:hypothetical protein